MKKTDTKFTYAVGRRKRSTIRIRLFAGKGQSLVNDKPVGEYFKDVSEVSFLKPFAVTGLEGKYYVTAKVVGGGTTGQLGAFLHGVSRALAQVKDGEYRKALKTAGLLTRDSREKERRKPGLAQSARTKKQSPKR